MTNTTKPTWLKTRGYLHLTNKINTTELESENELKRYVTCPKKVTTHAFMPLLHKKIPQRRYKYEKTIRKRSHKKNANGVWKNNKKMRPIHYATHIDAYIYAYYSALLQEKYEILLSHNQALSNAITAYRRIPIQDGKGNKNNIHFAKEVFDYIRYKGECCAMAFDIESFFNSLDHRILKKAWMDLLDVKSLPKDHYNVFKSITGFSYVLLDDFHTNGKGGYDEKQLFLNRQQGKQTFIASPKEFRAKIKSKEITIYKNQYHDKSPQKNIRGIPQGLPISAMLANLYLLEFDKILFQKISIEKNGLYKRYSDDIVVVCSLEEAKSIKDLILATIKEYRLEISAAKTEICNFNNCDGKLTAKKSFKYLGFEFNGHRTLLKSTNLSKFYRRMKESIKTKVKRLKTMQNKGDGNSVGLFKRKLYRLYTYHGVKLKKLPSTYSNLIKDETTGKFKIVLEKGNRRYRGNTLTYAYRASDIFQEDGIRRQVRNHSKILKKYLQSKLSKLSFS